MSETKGLNGRELTDKNLEGLLQNTNLVEDPKEELKRLLNPPHLNTKEKIYYWIGGLSELPFKLYLLGTILSGGKPEMVEGLVATATIHFGAQLLSAFSYKAHNPESQIRFNPTISYGNRSYSLLRDK